MSPTSRCTGGLSLVLLGSQPQERGTAWSGLAGAPSCLARLRQLGLTRGFLTAPRDGRTFDRGAARRSRIDHLLVARQNSARGAENPRLPTCLRDHPARFEAGKTVDDRVSFWAGGRFSGTQPVVTPGRCTSVPQGGTAPPTENPIVSKPGGRAALTTRHTGRLAQHHPGTGDRAWKFSWNLAGWRRNGRCDDR